MNPAGAEKGTQPLHPLTRAPLGDSLPHLSLSKPPPLLLGATLVFWGWQSGLLLPGLLMAVVLESARWVGVRWDFSDDEFTRIWTFCTLLFLGAAVFAFSANDGPADFRGFFQDPNFLTRRSAGTASARTAASLIRWLPMLFFLFVAAQAFSPRDGVPVETISLILSRRWKKARREGKPVASKGSVNVAWPFFAMCLFAASVHRAEDTSFFWGLCGLSAWALWSQRSRRFGIPATVVCLAAVAAMGYYGQQGLSQIQRYLENLNPQWLSRFSRRGFDPTQSQTSIGAIGRLKQSWNIVIRLETLEGSPPPGLLREASYVFYKAQAWYSGKLQNDFEFIQEDPVQRGTFMLIPGPERPSSVRIACSLPGSSALLPLPQGTSKLDELAAWTLRKNNFGALLAEGPKLVVFNARHGPGVTLDTPPENQVLDNDLDIPPKEDRALEKVVAELGLRSMSASQAAKSVRNYFLENFKYTTWQGRKSGSDGLTPLSRFLLQDRKGHCEHFASATVLLLRKAGIPARYAVGYMVHEKSGENSFVVRQRDAHAWALVWDERRQLWQEVDTTPPTWIELEGKQPRLLWFADAWSRVKFEIAKVRWGQTNLRQYILWALTPALILLLYQIVFRARRRKRNQSSGNASAHTWPGLDSEFYEIEKVLAKRGFTRGTGEPASQWLHRALTTGDLLGDRGQAEDLLHLHYRYRFDPDGLDQTERERLKRGARQYARELARTPTRKSGA